MNNLDSLNSIQKEAAQHFEGAALVLAGAGSGKTRIVTSRIIHLLEKGVPASAIVAVTFTNKAAAEMRQRVEQQTYHRVLINTFHSLCAKILRESIAPLGYGSDFQIYDEDDALRLIRACLVALGFKEKEVPPRTIKYLISNAKNQLIAPSQVDSKELHSTAEQHFPQIYKMYQEKLQESNALDFDDLLYLTVKLFHQYPEVLERYRERWQFMLVDEYQDTNIAQYYLVRQLIEHSGNLFVVGDPDQSIYSWRGANVGNIMNFERDFPGAKVVMMEQNYRSTSTILKAANALIKNNTSRYEKDLWSALGEGEKIDFFVAADEREEVSFVCDRVFDHYYQGQSFNDMVVFYRTNSQSRALEDGFLQRNIPYVIIGGISFYQRREVKDILAYLKAVYSQADLVSFARTVNLPKRGIGAASIEKIRAAAEQLGTPIFDVCEKVLDGEKIPGLRLTRKLREGLQDYVSLIRRLRYVREHQTLQELVKETIDLSGYLAVLREDRDTYDDRKANLDELVNKAAEWEEATGNKALGSFLEELTLKSAVDEIDDNQERVSLMTLHNGKGLEYDTAFIVGMEEDLFPHINSRDTVEQLEEERRLCYVGITRAQKKLYLTAARYRLLWGTPRVMRLSRFLKELPRDTLQKFGETSAPAPASDEATSSAQFSVGALVFHRDFGVGTVVKVYQSSLGLSYDVDFEDNQTRSLVAKYANLMEV
ncbi:MAG: ATP-dependent helicase [Chlamydiota bacterium]